MGKQVKLTEQELKQIIAEAVHNTINEDNMLKNWWNKLRGRANNDNNQEQNVIGGDDDEYQSSGKPFYYGGEPGSRTHIKVNGYNSQENAGNQQQSLEQFTAEKARQYGDNFWYYEDWMKEHHPEIQVDPQDVNTYWRLWQSEYEQNHQNETQPQPQQQEPQQPEPQQQQSQQQQTQKPQEQPQQQQPQYQRGSKYHVNFSKENEKMFNEHIVPSYNSLNNVMKALSGLKSIGQENYNQASSIFNAWGNNNQGGGQAAFKNVCQQIDSIMPILNNLKKEMKAVLSANGVRDSEDYKHYNMQEQKLRNIISSAISKVLNESRKR